MSQNCICNSLKEHFERFQKLIDDCLHRRALFCVVESSVADHAIFRTNTFVNFYANDYIRSQFADLRKFFDRDSRVYNFSFVIRHIEDISLKNRQEILFKEWKDNFCSAANKSFFHMEKFYMGDPINRKEFDNFLDAMNLYLINLREYLSKKGYELISRQMLPVDQLNEAHKQNFEEFIRSLHHAT